MKRILSAFCGHPRRLVRPMWFMIRRFFCRRITSTASKRMGDARAWKCLEGYDPSLASEPPRFSAADCSQAPAWVANAEVRCENGGGCGESASSRDPWVNTNRECLWDIETFSRWDHLKC
jgi:hypothetical protein